MGGVPPKTQLWNDLQERDYRTLEEFYARDEKYLFIENVEVALGKADYPTKNSKDKKEKKRKLKESKSNDQKRQRPEDRTPPTLLTRYTYYTELNADRAKVFQASEG